MSATENEANAELRSGFGPARSARGLEPRHRSSRAHLYRLLWRWHFYAGLLTAPVLIIASLTGAIYVFIHELQPVIHPELFLSKVAENPYDGPLGRRAAILDDAVAAAIEAYPQAKVVAAAEPREPGRNATVTLNLPEGFRTAFVDPVDFEVKGLYDEPNSFFGIVLALHRRLLAGSIGRMLVELTAAWGLILLLTGLYLWWPRRLGRPRSPVVGVWFPRFRGPFLPMLRDWHAVVGFYALVTAGFVLLTGLFFTQVFGNAYKRLSNHGGETPPGAFSVKPFSEAATGRPRIRCEKALEVAEAHLPGYGPRRVQFPGTPHETFRVTRIDWSNPTWKTTVFVDAYSSRVVHTTGWGDAPLAHQVRLSVYPIHTGEIFGLPTKILALLTCLALTLLAVTGIWMWWRKRPQNTWGLPPSNYERAPIWLSAMIFGLGVVLPAVGFSILVIVVGDLIVQRAARHRGAA
ncbi:MAG: PepSY domain-containing protein [Planctomycetaceae bacterium]|nr:PepSY domain-containing protein [Planctomycetaceae bacterium]